MEEAPTDVLRFRELAYNYSDGTNHRFYLSENPLFRKGEPKGYVSRWNAEHVLRALEEEHGIEEKSLDLPTPYESLELKQELRDLKGTYPGEWQRNLIISPNAPTETDDYVIMGTGGKVIRITKKARNIIPVSIYRDGKRHVVEADVFDIPFRPRNGRFNPEDVSTDTGFLAKRPGKLGKYSILFSNYFDERETIFAMYLFSYYLNCAWGPDHVANYTGLRVGSRKKIPSGLMENWSDTPIIRIDALDSMHGEEPKPFFDEAFIVR